MTLLYSALVSPKKWFDSKCSANFLVDMHRPFLRGQKIHLIYKSSGVGLLKMTGLIP